MSLLLMLASAASEPPICTDRPTKANATCTVAPGRLQIETAAIDWTLTKAGGSETKSLALGATAIKFGIDDRSDLQLLVTPFVHLKTGGASISGFGDVTVRYKYRITAGGMPVQIALIPFVKVPAAKKGIGNGKVEGGLAMPLSLGLGSATLTFGPEIDVLADNDRSGRHVAVVNLVNLAVPVATGLTAVGELWSNFNFDPAETVKQASADAALAYAVSNRMQLDAGANFGLTRDTADVELYAGISTRF
jgi:hypothetical protein